MNPLRMKKKETPTKPWVNPRLSTSRTWPAGMRSMTWLPRTASAAMKRRPVSDHRCPGAWGAGSEETTGGHYPGRDDAPVPGVLPGTGAVTDVSEPEAGLQAVELGPEDGWQGVAELLEPLVDLRDLFGPLINVDRERLLELLGGDIESVGVNGCRRWNQADGRLVGLDVALDAVEDVLEDAAVLAEARPQEPTVVIAAEPVDVEDLGELGLVVVLGHVDPVTEVVTGVVTNERQHRHGVAAHDADSASGSRRGL